MKQLKCQIEHWREIILPLSSILIWERPWYPGLIIGINSTIFLSVVLSLKTFFFVRNDKLCQKCNERKYFKSVKIFQART